MRGNIGFGVRLPNSNISNARQTLLPFSTFSNSGGGGGGSGRGRGRGSSLSGLGPFDLNGQAPSKPDIDKSKLESPESSESPIPPSSGLSGLGHGRGKPSPSPPSSSGLTSFSSFISSLKQSSATGRGQSTGPVMPQPENESGPKKPTLFKREDGTSSSPTVGTGTDASTRTDDHETDHHKGGRNTLGLLAGSPEVDHCPVDVMGALSGFGRGKPMKQEGPQDQVKEENKHLRAPRRAPDTTASKTVSMSQEDAVKNARKILSQGRDDGSSAGRGRGGFIGGRGRGRGRGRGSERFAGRGRGERDLFDLDFKDTSASRQYVEEEDDSGELLAQKVGPEVMNQLTEGFEELADRVLPTPFQDEYLDALDINCAIEFEPEYLMGEFDRNPDIDDKPPIPLRDALEKMKPFLMAYEGIQSQEEWEEIMEETMARVPLLKKIVDHYCGPDRVTAKKQQEELERVAKSLPQSAPSSVKRFADRAVLSLQSNPGWGFDKKCQFMDKLVWEASQHYK